MSKLSSVLGEWSHPLRLRMLKHFTRTNKTLLSTHDLAVTADPAWS